MCWRTYSQCWQCDDCMGLKNIVIVWHLPLTVLWLLLIKDVMGIGSCVGGIWNALEKIRVETTNLSSIGHWHKMNEWQMAYRHVGVNKSGKKYEIRDWISFMAWKVKSFLLLLTWCVCMCGNGMECYEYHCLFWTPVNAFTYLSCIVMYMYIYLYL